MSIKPILLATVIVLMAPVSACSQSDEGGNESSQATQRPAGTSEESPGSTQPSSDATATTATPSAPTVAPTPEWTATEEAITASPLATWDPSQVEAFHQAGAGPGALQISDGCVLLILEDGRKILPVWPEPTNWNGASQTIEYVGPGPDERAQLQAGDRVNLGGSIRTGRFSLYVREPTAECEAQAYRAFIVSEVRVESQ